MPHPHHLGKHAWSYATLLPILYLLSACGGESKKIPSGTNDAPPPTAAAPGSSSANNPPPPSTPVSTPADSQSRTAERAAPHDEGADAKSYHYTTHYSTAAAARYGFGSVKRIPRDGNCLFRAIADQLECMLKLRCPAQPHQVLRRIAANHIASHTQLYKAFTAEQTPAAVEKLIREMETNDIWGGQEALSALSRALQVTIVVISHNHQAQAPTVHRPAHSIGTIYLYYKDRLHYDSPQVTADSKPTEALATIIRKTTIDEAYTPSSSSAGTRQATKHLLLSTAAALQTEIQTGKTTPTEAPGAAYTAILQSYLGKDESVGKLLCEALNAACREELDELMVKGFNSYEGHDVSAIQEMINITRRAPQLSVEALEKLLLILALPHQYMVEGSKPGSIAGASCYQIIQSMPKELQDEAVRTLHNTWLLCTASSGRPSAGLKKMIAIMLGHTDWGKKGLLELFEQAERAKDAKEFSEYSEKLLPPSKDTAKQQPIQQPDADKKEDAHAQPSAEDVCAEFKKKIAAWQEIKDAKEKKKKLLEIVRLLAAPYVPLACIREAMQAKVPDVLLELLHNENLTHKKVPPALCNCLRGTPACAGAIFESLDLLIKKHVVGHEIYQHATEALVQGVLNNPSRKTSDEQCVNGVIAALQASYQKPKAGGGYMSHWRRSSVLQALAELASVKLCKPELVLSMLQKTFDPSLVDEHMADHLFGCRFFTKHAKLFDNHGLRKAIFKLLLAYRDNALPALARFAVSTDSREEAIPLLAAYKPKEEQADIELQACAWSILMAGLPESCLDPYIEAGAHESLLRACCEYPKARDVNDQASLIRTLGDMYKKLSPACRDKIYPLFLEKIKSSTSNVHCVAIQALSKVFECSDKARRGEILSVLQGQAEFEGKASGTGDAGRTRKIHLSIVCALDEILGSALVSGSDQQQTKQILELLKKLCVDKEESIATRQLAAEAILSHKSALACLNDLCRNEKASIRLLLRMLLGDREAFEEASASVENACSDEEESTENRKREDEDNVTYFSSALYTLQVHLHCADAVTGGGLASRLPACYRAAETLVSLADVLPHQEIAVFVARALQGARAADDLLIKLNADHFLKKLQEMLKRKQKWSKEADKKEVEAALEQIAKARSQAMGPPSQGAE